ncbi:hypothetical protein Tco_1418931 [Tanacetum coccineum]
MMVQAHEEMGEGSANPIDPHHTPTIIQPSTSQPQKKQKLRKPKRKDTEIPQSSGPTEPIAHEAANEENVPTHSNDPLLSGEDRLKLKELMALCTNLQNRVLNLEHTKITQALEIDSLKRRVKKLEKKQRSRTHKLKRLYKVGLSAKVVSYKDEGLGEEDAFKQGRKIHDIDADEDIYLVNVPRDEDMFGVNDLEGDEVVVESDVAAKKKDDEVNFVEEVVSTAGDAAPVSASTITTVELTLAQTLAELKSARPKAKGLMKKKDQVLFDEQEAIRLQAQFDEEARIAREKEEANASLIAQWNDIQDKVETDYELAQRLQAEEQEELTIEEKSKLFQQLLEKRRKHFAAKRVKERRNRPSTKAHQRSIMCTYLKNIAGWKPKDLKTKSFANVQELFDKAMKRVNTFVDMDTKLVEGSEVRAEGSETIAQESSLKRAGDELEQEKAKKQKIDDDQEEAELKTLMEIVPDEEEVAIDAIPLATKPPSILDWKIIKEGNLGYY